MNYKINGRKGKNKYTFQKILGFILKAVADFMYSGAGFTILFIVLGLLSLFSLWKLDINNRNQIAMENRKAYEMCQKYAPSRTYQTKSSIRRKSYGKYAGSYRTSSTRNFVVINNEVFEVSSEVFGLFHENQICK
jgi:hypothetical protein